MNELYIFENVIKVIALLYLLVRSVMYWREIIKEYQKIKWEQEHGIDRFDNRNL